jgi:hypothetical protein
MGFYKKLPGHTSRNTYPKSFAAVVVLKICSTLLMLIIVVVQALEN